MPILLQHKGALVTLTLIGSLLVGGASPALARTQTECVRGVCTELEREPEAFTDEELDGYALPKLEQRLLRIIRKFRRLMDDDSVSAGGGVDGGGTVGGGAAGASSSASSVARQGGGVSSGISGVTGSSASTAIAGGGGASRPGSAGGTPDFPNTGMAGFETVVAILLTMGAGAVSVGHAKFLR